MIHVPKNTGEAFLLGRVLGDDVFIGGWEDMEIFTQTQVRWNPASLHLAFRGNEELAFTLNITNVNTHIKKKS